MNSDWITTKLINGTWHASGTTPTGAYYEVWNADCESAQDARALLIFTIKEELAQARAMEADYE